jgi:ElaB/YqjD/DUF883 family membrane-anchored ribosome-binding protein
MNNRDEAFQNAQKARLRFTESLGEARRELTPAKLSRRALTNTTRRASAAVREHPGAVAGIAAGAIALIFRKPIAGLVRRLLREKRHD